MVHLTVQTSIDFDPTFIANVHVNLRATERQAAELAAAVRPPPSGANTTDDQQSSAATNPPYAHYTRLQWALKVLSLIDLTTLAGDDTRSNVQRLCQQAAHPLDAATAALLAPQPPALQLPSLPPPPPHTAAICVYPARVADAAEMLDRMQATARIRIAAVATGFPSGAYALASRLAEVQHAIAAGASEIDVVLDRALVLGGQWPQLYAELRQMRAACGDRARLKAILAVGECGSLENVHRAAMVAMMAGADFIKTSTGKEAVNATLPVGLVMIRAIEEFWRRTGRRVGLKPAGGVRTLDEAVAWLRMVVNTLGAEWLEAERFRFGASGLLDSVVEVVRREVADGAGGGGGGTKEAAKRVAAAVKAESY